MRNLDFFCQTKGYFRVPVPHKESATPHPVHAPRLREARSPPPSIESAWTGARPGDRRGQPRFPGRHQQTQRLKNQRFSCNALLPGSHVTLHQTVRQSAVSSIGRPRETPTFQERRRARRKNGPDAFPCPAEWDRPMKTSRMPRSQRIPRSTQSDTAGAGRAGTADFLASSGETWHLRCGPLGSGPRRPSSQETGWGWGVSMRAVSASRYVVVWRHQ